MAAQNVSKITRRLSYSSTVVSAGNSPSLVFFTPPPFSAKFGKKTPEHHKYSSAGGLNVFSPHSQCEPAFKSPRIKLFKNALRAIEASTGKENNITNAKSRPRAESSGQIGDTGVCFAERQLDCNASLESAISPSRSCTKNEDRRRPFGSLSKNSKLKETNSIVSETPAPSRGNKHRHGQLASSSRLRSQSSVLSPLSTCSPTTLAKYSVQISKITLTPVKTRFDHDHYFNQHDVEDDVYDDSNCPTTVSPDEDVVYFDTPFRQELVKKGLDGLDFKPRVLGRGGFGVVVSAFYGGKPVAVKMITKNNRRRRSIEISIQNEENALDLVRHPNLVQTYGIYELGQDHSIVVMEFAGALHLLTILENAVEVITCERRLNLVCQIADALRWCHIHEILHLDVKPANIMVSDNDHCKLGDFGCSRRLSEVMSKDDSQLLGGTIAYRAPELLKGFNPTFKADIYSLGITMWQILSREMPYKGLDPHVIIYKVVSCDTRPPDPRPAEDKTTDVEIYVELYTQLWCRRQRDRLDINQVVERLRSIQSSMSFD